MANLKVGMGFDAILFTTLTIITFFCYVFSMYNEAYNGQDVYVKLEIKDDPFDEYYLNSLLHSYKFSSDYKLKEFDCSQMSLLTHNFLEEHNFTSKIAIKPMRENNSYHSFVVAEKGNNTYIIETTSYPLERIGTITRDLDGYVKLFDPEELIEIDASEWTTNETVVPLFVWKNDSDGMTYLEYDGVRI